jgi:DUF1680 family protein/alpha-L-arabinofuranosidase
MGHRILRLCAAVLVAATLPSRAQHATITIDAARRGPAVDPRFYGIFLEEINHGVDGGLYGELVANRAFEDSRPPEGFTLRDRRYKDAKGWDCGFSFAPNSIPRWSPVREGGARGVIQLEPSGGLNEQSPYCLRLRSEDPAGGRFGAANEGFWGIGVHAGARYELSLHARSADFKGPLEVRLETGGGSPVSDTVKISGLGTEWRQFKATLKGTRDEPGARLVITLGGTGGVWLDFVSLFPRKTWKGHGLRPDIARMIADLKPGFVRFPGGCVIEGGSVETAYNWKQTVGPVEQRREIWGPWSYRRTHGMGFHEYLQFCEDLGAEPLHVGFAGQTCLFRELENVPMADMGWVLTNFLDAIEYANGPVDSRWGARRAQAGHPSPFGLKLVEIGNENGTDAFPPRYQFIHSALKSRYPDLRYIADLSWISRDLMRDCAFDIEDNHFYNSPSWFMANVDLYGNRDRQLPPVYLGEVAVTSGEGGDLKGNLIAALGEGAFLMGCERNADVVKMVSYAPLLAHVNGRSGWHGMIYHDSTRVFGTASYYLWKLFGINRPDWTVKTDVNYQPAALPPIAGGIGVGTWDTAAEFKDIRVEKGGQTVYASDFQQTTAGWQTEGGKWTVAEGVYRQGDNVVGLSYHGDPAWSNYTLHLKARKLGGGEGFLIAFGRENGNQYWWNLGGWGNREHGLEYNRTPVGRHARGRIETGRWYEVKIELQERRIRCYLDGQLIHDETAPTLNRFFAQAGVEASSGDMLIKAINTGGEPVNASLQLSGVNSLKSEGIATVLRSDRLDDNNSLENPTKIVPVNRPLKLAGANPGYTFPPYSLTILRLKHAAPGAAASPGPASASSANLALVATPSTSYVSGHETLAALNDGSTPDNSNDKRHGAYGNWPRRGAQWVQYEWNQPVSSRRLEVYWFDDRMGVRLPKACRLLYWDGNAFLPVPGASGLGLAENQFNATTYPELTTTKLRLEFDGNGESSTGILEWKVYDSGASPNFAPSVSAGVDRAVVGKAPTHLSGKARDDGKPNPTPSLRWARESGPGTVSFENAGAAETTARFSKIGNYVLKLTANDGQSEASDTLRVTVVAPPPEAHLDEVRPMTYQITSPFWRNRLKNLIVNWIPHCIQKIEDPQTREGGIENFAQAGRKLAGQPDAKHVGAVFANTWVYNTVESMCVALLVDPQGDPRIIAAQEAMRKTLDDWIPKMLSAQEPDGYLHTQYTIEGHRRWSNKHDHEGYQAGYFMEAAMAHCWMTGGQDRRMLDAARRLADCWVRNIGPAPKRAWYDGHQELEMALVKLARLVEQMDGAGAGRPYVELAKFLLDSRVGGDEYDQSHAPVTRQYEAVGHAVRAVYSYAGMADVAMETGDAGYHSAVRSIWNSIVNRKYYVTGGVGSGETSEGFGKDFSLPNHAYCESCANCGELFFQHRLQRIYHDARYADLAEETLYNAILGDVDLEGQNYTYTNPLDSSERRYKWHVCPCCVGNIPRTLLTLPSWTYTTGADELYVNLFAGSVVTLNPFAGTSLKLTQVTDYPWNGKVALTLEPGRAVKFALKIRVPNRRTSELYTSAPPVDGLLSLSVNGKPLKPRMENGYAVLERKWSAGDTVEWLLPMQVQRVKGSGKIAATRGRVALRYGPLIYNIESVDQNVESILPPSAPLSTEWRGDLLDGVMVIRGEFADGKPMLAIPNYARLNRGGRSLVWIKDE